MFTDRDHLQRELKQIKQCLRKVVECIINGTDYHKVAAMVSDSDELRS